MKTGIEIVIVIVSFSLFLNKSINLKKEML